MDPVLRDTKFVFYNMRLRVSSPITLGEAKPNSFLINKDHQLCWVGEDRSMMICETGGKMFLALPEDLVWPVKMYGVTVEE